MRSKSPSSSTYSLAPLCKRGRYLNDPCYSNIEMSDNDRGDSSEVSMETSPPKPEGQETDDVVKKEEEKLRAKYPLAAQGPHIGHTAFIQKRLAKGQKFFDSGDYNMYKQRAGNQPFGNRPRNAAGLVPAVQNPLITSAPTGNAIPTPETVPARKTSIIQQPKFPATTS
ncbi:unnamed protein product [Notodromas monacha]|uniref:cAMP-regulated phosphoprotein 19 n=1 Tax=Notodromas monacha TaxID=399045 RepID=A0A7R9GAA2_9CRUS|nr:unnamed protein product [Notodromas monacha]CAG0913789.1 unnamed protein product [Notodromas monacha]